MINGNTAGFPAQRSDTPKKSSYLPCQLVTVQGCVGPKAPQTAYRPQSPQRRAAPVIGGGAPARFTRAGRGAGANPSHWVRLPERARGWKRTSFPGAEALMSSSRRNPERVFSF
jgi:hypothetical protein